MAILDRFTSIIKANVNELLDKMEDPSKMIDQYLRELTEDLAEVKKSTAGVMAEEKRAKRLLDENQTDIAKYNDLAKKALTAGNEDDARVFLEKKQKLENVGLGLDEAYKLAYENSEKMRQMHDKLTSDINELKARKEMINAKVSVANTQETINKMTGSSKKLEGTMSAFERMEDKADRMLDEANATAELNKGPVDDAKSLEEKYTKGNDSSVDDELAKSSISELSCPLTL